jgi:hypothetical protein
LRTRASSSRNAPGADAMCRSIAPRGWFVPRSCPLADVDPPAKPSGSSPRSRCKRVPYSSSRGRASITNGRSTRSGRRWRKPPPDECDDTAPTRSIACCGALARRTKARPTPEPLHLGPRERGFASRIANPLTSFEPASHSVARDAEVAGQATQRGELVIGPEDLFLASRVVSGGGWVLDEAASASVAAVVRCLPFLVYPWRMVRSLWQCRQLGV